MTFGNPCGNYLDHAIAISAHYPQADGQTKRMNCTICQILHAYLLDEDQEHWPDYVAVTKMAINSTINASINKAPFEVFMVKTLHYLLTCYCLENPPSTLMLIHLLTR